MPTVQGVDLSFEVVGDAVPTCLFLCSDHALTSRLAESLFNAQAPRGWRATSAGLVAASEPDPRAERTLAALGYRAPEAVTRAVEKDLVSFMRVVIALALPTDAALPDWLTPKIDLRVEIEDPRPLPEAQLQEWMTQLNQKMDAVLTLCRERTPRPFG